MVLLAQTSTVKLSRLIACLGLAINGLFSGLCAESLPDIRDIAPDLVTPKMIVSEAAPGKGVKQTVSTYLATEVYHALYLPTDWKAGEKYPVICEYAGNGVYTNKFGDYSAGTVEGSNLGYGISGGKGFIWVCLPYVGHKDGKLTNIPQWWGEVAETKKYCLQAVQEVCAKYGGDTNKVFLAGFSRGAIACNYIGLHDDEIAKLWCGFIAHSHYDGVRKWSYADSDREAALVRLKRLNGRPQFISQEGGGTAVTKRYLEETGVTGAFTFMDFPYRNHTDEWVLRPIKEREQLRKWVAEVLKEK
jgi:hypothetical protein